MNEWKGVYGSTAGGGCGCGRKWNPEPEGWWGKFVIALWCLVLACVLAFCGCATTGNFNHIPQDPVKARKVFQAKRVWSGKCYEARVKRAHDILRDDSNGRPWVALYYLRCTPKDDWLSEHIHPRARRGWWRK